MEEKTPKLVDYSFSTSASESEDEPGPKRRAIGVVKPVLQINPPATEQSESELFHGSENLEEESNPELVENPQEDYSDQPIQ